MTRIRSLAPAVCPACGFENSFHLVGGQVTCVRCGFIDGEDEQDVTDAELEALFGDPSDARGAVRELFDAGLQRRRESYRPSYILRDRSGVSAYAEAIFSTAMDHVRRKDWDGAIHHLHRALDYDRDLLDAHLWLARLLADDDERRARYKAVLALDMRHGDALRELMTLDGELDPGRPVDEFTMPDVRAAGTVAAASVGVKCPRCGAPKLNADPGRPGVLTCDACGHRTLSADGGGERDIFRALLRKRAQPVEWIVGARVLSCNGCGAQRTFAAHQLAEHCPFCSSRNVVTQDALRTLSQPDAVVPFALDEASALDCVREALSSGFERLRGWFGDNRAERLTAEGVYLPYWAFDAAVDVTRTYQIRDDGRGSRSFAAMSATYTEQIADAAYNVLIPAVKQPPAWLLARLGRFDVGTAVAYKPDLIAQHGAELYTTDFDKASLDAHAVAGQMMRDKYTVNAGNQQTLSVFSIFKPISFRLLLLPVWAITITERDRDLRPALVNGQTGVVALGKAAKPS